MEKENAVLRTGVGRPPINPDTLLEVGRMLLLEGGFHLLTMERVAQRLGHSRSTVYKVFSSRSVLLGQVVLDTAERLEQVLAKVQGEHGGSRAALCALAVGYEVFARVYPEDFTLHQMMGTPGIRGHLLEADMRQLDELRSSGIQRLRGAVERGLESGDLSLTEADPASVLGSLYALSTGFLQQFGSRNESTRLFGVVDPWKAFHRAVAVYLDGEQWQPLSSTFDYGSLRWKILVECYPEHLRVLGENVVSPDRQLDGNSAPKG